MVDSYQTLSDNFTLGDSINSIIYKTLSENLNLSDGTSKNITYKLIENLNLNDLIIAHIIFKNLVLFDNLDLGDSFTRIFNKYLSLPENLNIGDGTSKNIICELIESLKLNDITSEQRDVFKNIPNNLKLKDKINYTIIRHLSESLNLSDSIIPKIIGKDLTENLILGDTINHPFQLSLLESLNLRDILRHPYQKILYEILNLDDVINTTYGIPGTITVYVYDIVTNDWIEVEGVEYFKVEKRLNQISKFNMTMPQIETSQKLYIKEFAKVMLFSGNTLILKGRIQKVTYQTAYECDIEGYGMEATILDKEYKNAIRSPDDPDRVQYDNISAQTIANELLSTNADGIAPWTMTPRNSGLFLNDYGQISIRYEFANKLTALGNLANVIDYDWWVDHNFSYTIDYFNIATIKGNQTAPDAARTFEITGAQANCEGTDYQRDVTNIANYIKIQGYGDGINQIYTSTYNASPTFTTLAINITSSAVTISLIDASSFAVSGTIRIAEEQITYTGKSGNDLTGCTRGTGGTTAKEHRAGCYLEKYVIYTSPEAGSSISDNGLMEMTLTYKEVRNESTLELIASNELLNRMTPIERMTILPNDPVATAENIQTGDLVKIEDVESSISGNYRIVTIIYENNYGILDISLEASNKSLTFIEQMQKEREKNQNLQKYMQGSTNVYVVNNSENCDNGYGCVFKTYIPPETIAINHIKLSYDVSAYRIYNTSTAAGGSSSPTSSSTSIDHTHTVNVPSHTHTVNVPSHTHDISATSTQASGSSVFGLLITSVTFIGNPTTNTVLLHSHYTPQTFMTGYSGGVNYYSTQSHTHNVSATSTNSGGSSTPTTSSGGSSSPTSASGGGSHSHVVNISSHTHGVDYGISLGSNTITDMQIFIDGTDRTAAIEAQIGHTLSINSTESDIDITQWITSIGIWHTIDIRPNGTCRISGDMWNQIFIESV